MSPGRWSSGKWLLALSACVAACRGDAPASTEAAQKPAEAAAENKPVVDQKIASGLTGEPYASYRGAHLETRRASLSPCNRCTFI